MNAERSSKSSPRGLHIVAPDRDLLRVAIFGDADAGKADLLSCLFAHTAPIPGDEAAATRLAFDASEDRDARRQILRQQQTAENAAKNKGAVSFRSSRRDYTIANERGDGAFLRAIILDETRVDAAVLVVDLAAGVDQAVRRHADILRLLAIRQAVVVVVAQNNADFTQSRFEEVSDDIIAALSAGGCKDPGVVPVALRSGDMVAERGSDFTWYSGPTLVEACDRFKRSDGLNELPFRMVVNESRKQDDGWMFCGRIEAGQVSVGDELVFSPSNKTAKLKMMEVTGSGSADGSHKVAMAGQSVSLTLASSTFIEREEIASHLDRPPVETEVFGARVCWQSDEPLVAGKRYRMKIGSLEANIKVESINNIIDPDDLSSIKSDKVSRGEIAEIVIRARRILAIDEYSTSPVTGSLVLLDGTNVVCGGIISMDGYADQRALITQRATNVTRVDLGVSSEARQEVNGHRGGVLWFTGLSGAGKSTLAVGLETRLHKRGYQTFVLDGDNVRLGLNANLGFSPEDRAENVRRVGEVAALFSTAGMIVISAFISPYRSDRDRAREAAKGAYHEVFIKADLAVCEERDPKGLYVKARAGEIPDFTGISAPYEAPEKAELVIDTSARSVEDCLDELIAYVDEKFPL